MLKERMINSRNGLGMIGVLLMLKIVGIAGIALLPIILKPVALLLVIAVFVFGEPFGGVRLFAFSCIWIGLATYGYDSLHKAPE